MSRRSDSYNRNDHIVRKLLATVTPPDSGTPVLLYAPAFNIETEGIMLAVKNLSTNQDRTAKFYQDPNGETWDDTTIIAEREVTKATEMDRQGMFFTIRSGSIGIESSTGGALVFTLWGIERPKQ